MIYVIVGILALVLFIFLSKIFELFAVVALLFVAGAIGFTYLNKITGDIDDDV